VSSVRHEPLQSEVSNHVKGLAACYVRALGGFGIKGGAEKGTAHLYTNLIYFIPFVIGTCR